MQGCGGETGRKETTVKPRHRWEYNINVDIK